MKKLLMHFFIAIPKKKETEEKKEPLNAIKKKKTFIRCQSHDDELQQTSLINISTIKIHCCLFSTDIRSSNLNNDSNVRKSQILPSMF